MIKKITVGFLFMLAGVLLIGPRVFAAITGSAHDFSSSAWNPQGEICNVCHAPHNATSNIAPLWNHTLTSANYTIYTSPTLNATVGQPSGSSKACLSCHDGTVALDSFGGSRGSIFMTGEQKLGTDLSNDHPVSFTYDAALATSDGGLHNPTTKTVASLGGKTVDVGMLTAHKVECSSCHDVHNNKGDAASGEDFLIVNNAHSALCLTCHNK